MTLNNKNVVWGVHYHVTVTAAYDHDFEIADRYFYKGKKRKIEIFDTKC